MTEARAFPRRTLLAAATLGLARPALAAASKLRILVLSDLAAWGDGAAIAVRQAVAEFGRGSIDRPIEAVSADSGGDPARARDMVRRWITEDGVEVVVVVPDDPAALAVQDVCRTLGRIALFCGPTTAALAGRACSPTGFQWTADDAALARAVAAGLTGLGITACRVEPNGTAERNAAIRAALADASIAERADADALVMCDRQSLVLAKDNVAINGPIFVPLLGPERVLAYGGLVTGDFTITPYDWTASEAARGWAKRFMDRLGRWPEFEEIGAYEAVRHYLRAIGFLGRTEGAVVARQMRAMPVDSIFSRGAWITADGQVHRLLRVMRVRAAGERVDPAELFAPVRLVPPEDSPVVPEAATCRPA